MALHIFDDHDGIIHHQARGQGNAEKGERVDRKVEQPDEEKGAHQRNRNRYGRNQSGAPVLQENEDDQDDQQDRLEQREQDVLDGFTHHGGGVKSDLVLQTAGKLLREARQFSQSRGVDFESVGMRELGDADADSVVPIELQARAVILSAKLSDAYVSQSYQASIRRPPEDDTLKLGRIGQAAHGANADLIGLIWGRRRLSYLAGRDLDVLFAKRLEDIAGGEAAARHLHGVEPDSRGVLAFAEDEDIRNAFDPFEGIPHVDVKVVADEQAVVLIVLGIEGRAEDKVRGALDGDDSRPLHLIGKTPQSGVDAVLNVNGSKIHIPVQLESSGDGARPIIPAG